MLIVSISCDKIFLLVSSRYLSLWPWSLEWLLWGRGYIWQSLTHLVGFLSFFLIVFLFLLTNAYTSSGCFYQFLSIFLYASLLSLALTISALSHFIFLSLSALTHPSLHPSVCPFVCKIFTFSSSSPEPQMNLN